MRVGVLRTECGRKDGLADLGGPHQLHQTRGARCSKKKTQHGREKHACPRAVRLARIPLMRIFFRTGRPEQPAETQNRYGVKSKA